MSQLGLKCFSFTQPVAEHHAGCHPRTSFPIRLKFLKRNEDLLLVLRVTST